MANPHYKPELQAQTTLINFTVTEDGLEDQLLAEAVDIERPDLEKVKVNPLFISCALTVSVCSTLQIHCVGSKGCLPPMEGTSTSDGDFH